MFVHKEAIQYDGVLISVGGTDVNAQAILKGSDNSFCNFEVSRELAKRLASNLFGPTLRLTGIADAYRNEQGNWGFENHKAIEFEIPNDDSLPEVIERIRAITKDTDYKSLVGSEV